MVKARPNQKRVLEEIGEPPNELGPQEVIVTVLKPRGNNQYDVKVPTSEALRAGLINNDDSPDIKDLEILVTMPPKFRNAIFVKRGGYAVVELHVPDVERESKVKGHLTNIVHNNKEWQKMVYWPVEYRKEERSASSVYDMISDEEEEEEGEGEEVNR